MKLLAPNGKPTNLTPEQYRLVRTPAFKKWFGDWENSPETASKVVDDNGEPLIVYHGSKKEFSVFFNFNKEENIKPIFFFAKNIINSKFYGKNIYTTFLNIRNPKIYIESFDPEIYIDEKFDGVIIKRNKNYDNWYVATESYQIKLADGTNTTFDSNNPDIRFMSGGNVLLAPNGKPSNLTPEQYRLVRTPAFKKWFGDWENSPETSSKVVDEETKEPKVMYHGSKNDFTIFNPKAEAINRRQNFEGFYFTGNKNRAESYSNIKLFEVFINIRNPLNRHLGEHLPSYKSLNYIREKYKGDFNKEYLEEKMFQLQRTGRNSFIDGEDMTKILIMDDYDGVFDGSFDYGDTVAFNSTQIKLADGTNTTFDSNNPDIRYKNGGGLSNLNIDGYIFDLDKDNSIENEKVFKINDNKGDSIGKIYIVDKNGAYHIENVRLNKERTGVGYDIYKKLISILDKPIKSGEVQNEKAKGLWDKLVKEGLAKKEGNGYVSNSPEYKNGGLTMKKPKAKLLAPNGKPSNLTPEQYKGGGLTMKKGEKITKAESEIKQKLSFVEEKLNQKKLTPSQILYLASLLNFGHHDIQPNSSLKINFYQKRNELRQRIEEIAKPIRKGYVGYLDEEEAYHFTNLGSIFHIIEDGHINTANNNLSITTNFLLGEKGTSTVKNYRGMGNNAELFSDLPVKLVLDINKLKKEAVFNTGKWSGGTHFGEYELIVSDFKKPFPYYIKRIEIDKNEMDESGILNYPLSIYKDYKYSSKSKPITISFKDQVKKLNIPIIERKRIDVKEYLFGENSKNIRYAQGGGLNDFVLYHGTGNAKKVIQALKDGSFRFYKSAGVEKGMYLTSNKKLALEYANDSQNTLRKGEDIGILEIRFNKIPNFKKYNNYGEQYYDEIKPNYNPKESSIEYTKDLISNNYDGYSIGDVYLLFKEKIDLIDVNKTSIIRYELGGELTLTTEQVENKLGRKLHWWDDDVVSINGIEYKKVFLRPEYKRL